MEPELDYVVAETSKLHWTIFNSQVKTNTRYKLIRSDANAVQMTPEFTSVVKQNEQLMTLIDAGTTWLGIGLDNWQR